MNCDLTVGKPSTTLWKYTLPMFISVVFQQFYNIADSAIAGKFAGESALAAIGASYPITMIFMAVATGSSVGVTVVISQYFGARRYGGLKTAAYTTMIFGTVLSLVLTAAALICSPMMLRAIQTPESIFADAEIYMNIYLGGFLFLYLYNVANGVFNAMGDSKTPLYLLILSSLGNVVLDYILVAIFRWGVAGAGWGTFIMQGVACVLSVILLFRRLRRIETESAEKIRLFSFGMLGVILAIAVPSILQSSFVSVGNLFIQSLINSCGESVIAGFSAAFKLNTFAITSMTTIASGVSSFTAQNIGAGKFDRVKKGFSAGIMIALIITIPFTLCYTFIGQYPLSIFMEDTGAAAMATGKEFLIIAAPFYALVCIKLICDGVLRGARAMLLFMITTFSDLVLRVALSYILFPIFGETGIWYSWPIGWIIAAIISAVFYFSGIWKKKIQINTHVN